MVLFLIVRSDLEINKTLSVLRAFACPVAPADLSASGGWYWGDFAVQKLLAVPKQK